jgi:hypothetical protein
MHVSLDGRAVDVPGAATLGELLDGITPLIDPTRLVTRVEVDGAPADGTDRDALARWRLVGGEVVTVGTEAPAEFAAARRREIPHHLRRLAELFAVAADGFATGAAADANRVLAAGARELGLVLELDRQLTELGAVGPGCDTVAATVRRIGPRLTDAEQGGRWAEVATLLAHELVPALRAAAA